MFFRKINMYNEHETFYKRAAKITLIFVSPTTNKFGFGTSDPSIKYICDEDFFNNVINKLVPLKDDIKLTKNDEETLFIIIDAFPEELYSLFILTGDPVYSFKMYLKDDKLDKLVKE